MATQATQAMSAASIDRLRGCLWGIFIGDALSMPVHWYYDPAILYRDFGEIKTYQAPKVKHPGSIMALSNTGGHGRGGQEGRTIGDVINHGKHEFWGKPGVHYHQGMAAGDNTLNALCARVVMRGIAAQGTYDWRSTLSSYVSFMTTPGSHNDTYAESFHRDFFSNWANGVPPEECARGTEGHNTAQIGGFVMLPPVILSQSGKGTEAARTACSRHLTLTHESSKLASYADLYSDMLYKLVNEPTSNLRDTLRTMASGHMRLDKLFASGYSGGRLDLDKLLASGLDDRRVVHSTFGSACYIEDSFPSMTYLAFKYADAFDKGVLSNTNVGGENCHRGAALGALLGAGIGESGIPRYLIEGLHESAAIKKEIDSYVSALFIIEA
ncbi:hypothetical protein FOA52_006104 [Chlamydomonas sp. UWO 241]|nr:hypothetical protein FOA52_006104 [Chlamydomonas sp. UWO 241]